MFLALAPFDFGFVLSSLLDLSVVVVVASLLRRISSHSRGDEIAGDVASATSDAAAATNGAAAAMNCPADVSVLIQMVNLHS